MDAEQEICRAAIRAGLLDLFHHWRQADEPELTAEELHARLELTFVRIDTIIPTTLNYAVGDAFGGHTVDVELDEQLKVTGVHLVG